MKIQWNECRIIIVYDDFFEMAGNWKRTHHNLENVFEK